MYQLYRDRPLLVLCMIIANIVLSAWCLYLDPVINFDGVTYTAIAKLFLDGQVAAAFDYYSWPFYSLFIAGVSKLLFIDVELAAFVLNTILATSLTLAFVCIVGELSNNNRRIILIAVVVIVLFPSITKYRSFVIRDFGYLGCYLWSLYFIFRYCATLNKNHLIGWLFFAGLSSLFRFEGIVFILIAPYFLFLFSTGVMQHRKKLLVLLSIFISLASIALLYWYINDKYMDSVEAAKLSGMDIHNLREYFSSNIQKRLGNQSLTPFTFFGLLLSNTGDVIYELIRRMAIFYFVFVVYAYVKRLTLRDDLQRKIWQIYVITNLLMLVGFSLSNNFIVSRYAMASALTLLILAPFAIDYFYRLASKGSLKLRLGYGFVVAILVVVSLEGLNVKTNKMFIKSAGQWVNENVPKDATVYSNNKLAIYYAQLGVKANLDHLYSLDLLRQFMQTGQIKSFEYIILIGKRSHYFEDLTRQTLWYRFGKPEKIYYGDKDNFAFIYDINRRAKLNAMSAQK